MLSFNLTDADAEQFITKGLFENFKRSREDLENIVADLTRVESKRASLVTVYRTRKDESADRVLCVGTPCGLLHVGRSTGSQFFCLFFSLTRAQY